MSVVSRVAVLVFALVCVNAEVGADTVIRDFYEEPGLNPFKNTLNQNMNEHIDPFSGGLQLSYEDLVVPGNGGLDLRITRVYNSLQESPGYNSPYGIGWTIHFGRVIVNADHDDKVCSQQTYSTSTIDNPSLELPDGGRQLLLLADDPDAYLITRNRWKAECKTDGSGFVVIAPNGTQYIMDQRERFIEEGADTAMYTAWYTSQIKDTNGNTIDITYQTGWGYTYVDEINTSDGRYVDFEYLGEESSQLRLSKIIVNGQAWQYNYVAAPDAVNFFNLAEVVRPDGTTWQYEYYGALGIGQYGAFSLKRVAYPYGGTLDYTYGSAVFDPGIDQAETTVVAEKTVGGRDVTPGTWTFSYSSAEYNANGLDITTVNLPDGSKRLYYHYGYSNVGNGGVWTVGLQAGEEIFDTEGNLLEQTVNDWDVQVLSQENYWHGRDVIDNFSGTPLLLSRSIWRGGSTYLTEYQSYDAYGNPGRVVETGNIENDQTRSTTFTYHIDKSKWILNRTKDETLEGVGTIARQFDENGNLVLLDRYGAQTTYTYTAQGDLGSETNARNYTTQYQDYYRGIPRHESRPEGVILTRSVNPSGTVSSETNARGYITTYAWDPLNRLAGIGYPVNADVSITYTSSGKSLVRGRYAENMALDGFGREISKEQADAAAGVAVSTTTGYDALGQKVFSSYPNSLSGTSYEYDALGRQVRLTHADGEYIAFFYDSGNRIRVADERGFESIYLYRAFGDPDERSLVQVISPENMLTVMQRNALGQLTLVWQGEQDGLGYQREYTYDGRFYLASIKDPETGTTEYGRDALGNMISRSVGLNAATLFSYDGLDRKTFVDFPGSTPDVTYQYDGNGNVVYVGNTEGDRSYQYDGNDNLLQETVTVGGGSYQIAYTFTLEDFVDTITYPSGRVISFSTDALGRPTQAAPYVNQVGYHPTGQIAQLDYANGQSTQISFDIRQRIERIFAGGQVSAVDTSYGFDPAGNISAITDALDSTYNISLGYDGLDRMIAADGKWGSASYSYDTLDNLQSKTVAGETTTYTYSGNRLSTVTLPSGTTEQVDYDTYGNIAGFAQVVAGEWFFRQEFTFDHAGGMVSAKNNVNAVVHSNAYDGDGMRIMRQTGGRTTHFVYASDGTLLGEYDSDPLHGKEYIYVGGQLVASVKENAPPEAFAGMDRIVGAGSSVSLDGAGSSDPDGEIAAYAWNQVDGPAVTLTGSSSAVASFTAPAAGSSLVFELTVTDEHGASDSDTVNVTVNQAPVADAGGDKTVYGPQTVQLDGAGSYDAEGTIEAFRWTQIEGPWVSLANYGSQVASFDVREVHQGRQFVFELTVTDELGVSDTDAVSVWAYAEDTDADGNGIWDAWEVGFFGGTGVDPAADPDGDGLTNLQEFEQGTDPTEPEPAPEPVQGLVAIAGDGETVVSWTDSAGVAQYDLYWSNDAGVTPDSGTLIADVSSPYVHPGLSNGETYYYVVNARNNAGNALSVEASATPGQRRFSGAKLLHGHVDGTTSPHIAADDIGNAMAVWVQQDGGEKSLWAKRYVAGSGWGQASLVGNTNEAVSGPRIAIDGKGNAIAVWLQNDGTRNNVWGNRYAAETGWGAPVLLEYFDGTDRASWDIGDVVGAPQLAMNERGQAVVVWLQEEIRFDGIWGDSYTIAYGAYYDPDDGWAPRWMIDRSNAENSYPPHVAIDEQGAALAVWARRSPTYGESDEILANRYVTGAWAGVTKVANADTRGESPGVGVNAAGKGVAVWPDRTRDVGSPRAAMFDPETGWESPQSLSDNLWESNWRIGIDDSGRALATWYYSNNNGSTNLIARHYDPAAGWGGPINLVSRGGAMRSHALAVSGTGDATLVWTEDGDLRGVRYDGATWGETQVLGTAGWYATAPSVGQSETGDVLIAWPQAAYGKNHTWFTLYAVDGGVFAPNTPPAAEAGPDQSVLQQSLVTLDATASSDPDGTVVGYRWEQLSGTSVSLSGVYAATPSFTSPTLKNRPEDLLFQLTVMDDVGELSSDQVTITVNP